ncbi:MAG: glycosyltransferase family 2 protein, partial [Ruminococcus sp.]
MSKILSVSIASYNVEKFLSKALDSCLIGDYMDKLEVIIVNDGSKDRTDEVAGEYVNKYPETFKLINKQNGGYGSTVNAGIKAATGKYFRLLDGDDWFDSKQLIKFIDLLENSEEDMIVAHFMRVFEEDGHSEERDESKGIPFESGRFEDIVTKDWFTMHAVSYKTSILQNN